MLSFECDYNKGAHPAVLQRLLETNLEPLPGYGSDVYSESAKKKIQKACGAPDAQVHFLTGGTQTNQIVIDTMLEAYEGVIAADTGHVSIHEAGAVEFTGHKVLPLPNEGGKLTEDALRNFLTAFFADENHEHMVFPGMVYISHPTEYGTLYSLQELERLSHICRDYDLPLFLDGARLGYGLMSREATIALPDLAELCDVFSIGGTKVGALCGEAVVFTHGNAPRRFLTRIKQHGALLAKGRLLGIQFDALFTEDLYFKIGKHAIEKAERLKEIFQEKKYIFFNDSPTNQIFIVLENDKMRELEKQVGFGFWEPADEGHTVVRFATSWATTDEELAELKRIL